MGYCLFKLHRYTDAIVWFRKYVDFMEPARIDKKADANNRIGDCYFISREYAFAVDYYQKAIVLAQNNIDYAMFQKGFSEGLLKKYPEEIETLKQLINTYPSSLYRDDAIYEIANAYELMNDHSSSILYYTQIIDKFPHSKYRVKSYLQRALLDYNGDKNEEALVSLKKLVAEYPKTEEAQKALLIMKNIYVDLNRVDDYIGFAKGNDIETELTKREEDSLKYIVAENLYMNGDCKESVIGFRKYIEQYPKGRYLLNAYYFKADCEYKNKEYTEALPSYEYVINQNINEYMEDALLKAAFITFNDSDYTKAIVFYQKLQQNYNKKTNLLIAKVGLMRSYYRLKDYNKAIKSAMRLLPETSDKESLAREVHYVVGNSFYALKDNEAAYPEFSIISDNLKSTYGAEAMCKMIDIEYQRKNYDIAIELIKKFKGAHSPHQYWVAKSFIVWAKIFQLKDDYFMAKATLQSVIKYYPKDTDGVKKEAIDNLNNILDAEEEDAELDEAIDDVEINLNENTKENKLFEEDKDNEK
jgi:TolA-binding protein